MSDTTTATIRTTVNAVVMAIVAWAAANITSIDIDLNNPVIIAVIGVLTSVVYSLSLFVVRKWPILGRILFGVSTAPSYQEELPPAA